MRPLLVIILGLAVAGGAFWLLRPSTNEPQVDDLAAVGAPGPRPSALAPGPAPLELPKVARVGIMSRLDRDLAADPDAPPWHMRMLQFPGGGPGVHLTGEMLVEAIAKHLYVRARDLATLEALKKETFEVEAAHEMPLGAVVPLLAAAGYEADVQDPRFNVRRKPPGDLAPPR